VVAAASALLAPLAPLVPVAWADEAALAVDAPEPHPIPDDEVLEAEGARIGKISIRVSDVFDLEDPEQDKKIFRFVNRLHRTTRDGVILEELLFEPGDTYSSRLLAESERKLRERRYLYDADIKPVEYRDGTVDIHVDTRDVWTLNAGVAFSRSGGENTTRLSISDTNFLGTGKEVGISRKEDVDRVRSEAHFRDYNLFGNHSEIEVSVSDNSDGNRYLLHLRRPFFALDTRRSKGMTLISEERIDPIFDRGQVISEFRHKIEVFDGHWGFSGGLDKGSVKRWKIGYTFIRDQFFEIPERPPTIEVPADRTLSYPWVDFEFVQDRFIKTRDLDKIARTEDLNLGTRFQTRLGYSTPTFGGDEDLVIFGSNASTGFHVGTGKLLFADANVGLRWGRDGLDTLAAGINGRFYWRDGKNKVFYSTLQTAAVENLDPEQQLLIGGDSGLRGYPLRFESGDRRVLLTLEQRFFTQWELFKLATVGAAVFFDVGRAWFVGQERVDDFGVLKDIGFGLRLGPSRSGGKTLVHLDVAFPLDGDGSFESVQWLVSTHESL